MTDTKPQYELRRRGKTSYVGLWQGDHCLAAICVNTTRGVLDAQLLLLVMNSHKELLAALQAVKLRLHFVGLPSEPMNDSGPDWSKEINLLEAAIANAKPKTEQERAKSQFETKP